MKNTFEALNWRYAIKKYDSTKKLSAEQIELMLEAVRMAPTSFGLQPFRAILVSNPEVRAKLCAAGYGQSPITDASHFLVFAAMTDLSPTTVDKFISLVSAVQGKTIDQLSGYHQMISGSIASRTPEQNTDWAARQAYIALGVLLTAAATNEIDATPMEGFNPKEFNAILGLDEMHLTAVCCAALGFRAAGDEYATNPKVRLPKDKLFIEIK